MTELIGLNDCTISTAPAAVPAVAGSESLVALGSGVESAEHLKIVTQVTLLPFVVVKNA